MMDASINQILLAILEKTTSSDKNELDAAQNFLEQAAKDDLIGLLKQLSDILKNPGCGGVARFQAGIQLKNALYSKDLQTKQFYQSRWLQFPIEDRIYIRQNCLSSLGTELSHGSAAQCVAYIACAEIPMQQWPDLMGILVQNVINTNTEGLKQSTLETIGYICQDIDPMILSSQSNEILTAIVNGMKKEEPSENVRLAATNALLNSLEFTRQNFDDDTERHYIMQVVCETTQSANTHLRVAALQCLVKIMSLYYAYMEHYMANALFAITLEAMKSDIDEVSLQGIEFWSTVCDEEIDLAIDAAECAERNVPPQVSSKFYAKGALNYILPELTDCLTKQEELDDEDEWNPCKAAGVCLMLLAQCCENDIVESVLPFVKANIKSPDWKFRDAAVMSFGSILEGPDPPTLKPLVQSAMPVIIELLRDQSAAVRDSSAWTIGRVCEILPDIALNETHIEPLLSGLLEGLSAEPRVATNVCWAISSLAEGAFDLTVNVMTDQDGDCGEPGTYVLSKYYNIIIDRLLETTDRIDGNQNNLRNAAYSALMELLKSSARDCYETVQKTTVIILERLETVLRMENQAQSNQEKSQINDLESLLCATLQSVLRKIDRNDAPHISDKIMTALLQMFKPMSNGHINSTGVQEDALLAVSALVDALGVGFLKYLEVFMPVLIACLRANSVVPLCLNAIGLMSDMCRVLNKHLLCYMDELFAILMETLANVNIDKSIRPHIISAFGDFALALGPEFVKYIKVILDTLQQASQAVVDLNDPDMVDYLNELRNSCLECYTGIVQGLKEVNEYSSIESSVPYILQFIELVGNDDITTDPMLGSACGLIGDLVTAFAENILPAVERDTMSAILQKGRRSKTNKTKSLATWATKEIRKLRNAQQQT